jgi:hypothetical protein
MKKLISILAFLSVAFSLAAQDFTISYGGLGGMTTGSTGSGATGRKVAAYSYVIKNDTKSAFLYEWSVRLQQTHASNNTATISLWGALENASASYKQIGSTVTWAGTTADTCAVGTITSSPLSWRFIKFVITPSDTCWVEHVYLNLMPTVFINAGVPGR